MMMEPLIDAIAFEGFVIENVVLASKDDPLSNPRL